MNSKIPLEIFLPASGPEWPLIHCLITNDLGGLNNGVYFLRVHEWSVWLMSAVLAVAIYDPKVYLKFNDQSAMEIAIATVRTSPAAPSSAFIKAVITNPLLSARLN